MFPENGYDGFLIENYKDFIARDIARIFLLGLEYLGIHKLFALIGGSLGGGIAWEMAALRPDLATHLIPVASDWKSTDWLIANCQIQEQFLVNSSQPVHDARMHAMLCYRTPESFKQRFRRSTNEESRLFNVESWLLHHGKKLQERFQLAAYKLTNQLLKTIDITRGGEEAFQRLQQSATHIHIIGVDSDLFFTAAENKETYKQLAQVNSNVTYGEIHSVHGHDAFLIEFDQMEQLLQDVFGGTGQRPLKVLKFGGKSLANGEGIDRVLDIISARVAEKERVAVVLSAREKATDQLEELLELAADGKDYSEAFSRFENYQRHTFSNVGLGDSFEAIARLLEGVRLLGDYSPKIKDQVLAQGELLSARLITKLLIGRGLNAVLVDARELIRTDSGFGNAQVLDEVSRENVNRFFSGLQADTVAVVTGFIASNALGETTTLGRNGSNYTASLLANYLNASELQNYTHVNGIYTANPDLVPGARRIEQLSYSEANELANFGATILHAKTIIPLLEKNIPLRILNTFDGDGEGTLISARSSRDGIRSLSVIEHEALIHLGGTGAARQGRRGCPDFQGARTERDQCGDYLPGFLGTGYRSGGTGGMRRSAPRQRSKRSSRRIFRNQDITRIHITSDVSVISIVGQDLSTFHKPYNALIRNQVIPLLFNNTVTGKNVSLVVRKADTLKALNVMHGQIFGISKKINLAVFGVGTVGSTLMHQLLASADKIEARKGIRLNVFAVANSTRLLLDEAGVGADWSSRLSSRPGGLPAYGAVRLRPVAPPGEPSCRGQYGQRGFCGPVFRFCGERVRPGFLQQGRQYAGIRFLQPPEGGARIPSEAVPVRNKCRGRPAADRHHTAPASVRGEHYAYPRGVFRVAQLYF